MFSSFLVPGMKIQNCSFGTLIHASFPRAQCFGPWKILTWPSRFSSNKTSSTCFLDLHHSPHSPACMLSHVRLFATPWTVACQAPLFMEFSRQKYWSGLLFPTQGDLLDPGIKPAPPPASPVPTKE